MRYKKEAEKANLSLEDYISNKFQSIEKSISKEEYYKNFCLKYNMPYKNIRSWANYTKQAEKYNITTEEYIIKVSKENKEKEDKIKFIKELCEKYNFPCDKPSYIGTYISSANKMNLSLEDYFKLTKLEIDKEEKEINECIKLCEKYNLPYSNKKSFTNYRREAYKRNLSLNDYLYSIRNDNKINNDNNFKDLSYYQKQLIDLIKKYGFNFSHKTILSLARKNNFNTDNDLKDVEDFLKYRKCIEDNKNLEKLEKIKILEKYNFNEEKLVIFQILASKYNISFEECVKNKFNDIQKEKKENEYYINLLNYYGIQNKDICKLKAVATKNNLSLEKYLQINYDLKIEKQNYINSINDLIKKYNIDITYDSALSAARRNNFNSGDNLNDIEDYFIQRNKKESILKYEIKIIEKYNLPKDKLLYFKREANKKNISFEEACQLKRSILDAEALYKEEIALISDFGFIPRRLNSLKKRAGKKNMTLNAYMDTLVWCNECQQFEDPEYNAIPEHWKDKNHSEFYLCRIWMDDHKEEVKYLESHIIGFDKLIDGKVHCGVYRWYIDGIPYYFGLSNDILRRAHEHFMNIVDYPDWWLNIYEEMKNGHTLEIKFIEYSLEDLEDMEKYHIFQEYPISQICKGNKPDTIIPLEERLYNLENIEEFYLIWLESFLEDYIFNGEMEENKYNYYSTNYAM